jgi:two-component system, response regulator FlrC
MTNFFEKLQRERNCDEQESNNSTYLDFLKKNTATNNSHKPRLINSKTPSMQRIQDIILQVAETKVPILITGEHGSGKKNLSKIIHASSQKDCSSSLIFFDCRKENSKQIENTMFGPSCTREAPLLETIDKGTIVFANIDELEIQMQKKLLKLIQEKNFISTKDNIKKPFAARIIATTEKNLQREVKNNRFIQDLYYRIYVIQIDLPSLRERKDDIKILVKKFLSEHAAKNNLTQLTPNEQAIDKIINHTWPGNISELEEFIETIYKNRKNTSNNIVTPEEIIFNKAVSVHNHNWIKELPIGNDLKILETHFIIETLKSHGGNRTHSAKTLGISLRTLRNKINEFSQEGHDIPKPSLGRKAFKNLQP